MYKIAMFLYDKESVYGLDQSAVRVDGISEINLMQRAGARVWNEISNRWPEKTRITIFAGSGNNGGDAFVVAILAKQQDKDVQLIVHGDLSRQSDTSVYFRKKWQKLGGDIVKWDHQTIFGEVVVDGLLGIGLKRDLDYDWQALIEEINRADTVKVAIDIPSGLNANTGNVHPCAVEASLTVTFIAAKVGQYLACGPDFCGELVIDDLGVSSRTIESQAPTLTVLEPDNVVLPARRKCNSHKNEFGHILVVGGDHGMAGAASLAAQAALRAGAGLVTVLVHPDCVHYLSAIPELMVQSWDEINAKLGQATVVVIGPGLGQSEAANFCLQTIQTCNLPMVVDASALKADFLENLQSDRVVITPHPGEAAKLLSTTSAEIQADRMIASQKLVESLDVVSVLKGSGSIIQETGSIPAINVCGNSGMASAGMGDVLAGLIAALLGQKLTPFEAAKTGVLIHALCAEDYATQNDEIGLIASDIVRRIPSILKQLR